MQSYRLPISYLKTAKPFVSLARSCSTIMQQTAQELYFGDDNTESPQSVCAEASAFKSYETIPGPKQLPLIGNAWRFAPLIGHYKVQQLDKVMWALHEDYGNIVKVGGLIGHPDLLFVFSADGIEKVFRREETLPHRPSMPSLHYYKQRLHEDFFRGNEGVIGVHGAKWEQFRKKVQQVLLPPTAAKRYIGPLNDIANDFLERIADMRDERDELPDDFLSEIYKWALESVARVSLDRRLGCLSPSIADNSEPQRIIDSINAFFWNVADVELKLPIWRVYKNSAFRKYIRALETFRITCMKYIEETMRDMHHHKNLKYVDGEDASIVERILRKSGDPKLAAVLALDLLLVGVDTTSIALASTIYQLTKNPRAQEQLYAELRAAMPDKMSPVDAGVLERIPFLKACVKETLRMYPVIIGNGRSLQTDAIIGGYHIPKGVHVIFPHLVVSNMSNYFSQPERFVPERWIRSQCAHQQRTLAGHHPFASLPFGYGRRSCLGRRFAEAELHILLAKIFRRYRAEYNYGELTYKITPTYVPEQPLKFKLTERAD